MMNVVVRFWTSLKSFQKHQSVGVDNDGATDIPDTGVAQLSMLCAQVNVIQDT